MRISQLPPDVKEKALYYFNNAEYNKGKILIDNLADAFDWLKTTEGFEFWRNWHLKEFIEKGKDSNIKIEGLRFNTGKARHDLIPSFAQEQYAKVLTKGSEKYAERNWELGMKWSKVTASLKRHTLAFEKGEDFDTETGLLHTAHIMCNAAFLTEYYKIYPQGDDRPHHYLNRAKIGLDIDEVLADWVGHWTKHHGQEVPENWNFDRDIAKKFDSLKDDKEFWLSIPVKTKASDIHFEPHCYITSRSIPIEWTKEWLDKNGFPTMPVYSVGFGESKVDVAKESGIDIYVDDRYENFVELNNAGICTFLFDAPHNKRYDVGFKRITSISELS